MRNKFETILKRADINYKKELLFVLIINLFVIGGMIAIYLLTNNNLIFIPFIFLIVLINAVTFYRYLFLYSKNITEQIKEFTFLLRYLYLDINNQVKVKNALINLKEKASLKMNKKLETLLEEIKQDSSLIPYLHFASDFANVLVEELMLNLYRLDKRTHKENLEHFNSAYFKLKQVVDEDCEKDNSRQFEFIKSTAIIGTAIIVILVIVVTIIIVEEYIHG